MRPTDKPILRSASGDNQIAEFFNTIAPVADIRASGYCCQMLRAFDRKDIQNAISGFLAGYGGGAFVCFFYLVISWAAVAPHSPDPAHGLIFPHNEHGSITYFSGFQGTSCALLMATSPLFFMLGVCISPKKDVIAKTGTLSFSMRWKPDDPRKIQRVSMTVGAIVAPMIVFLIGPSLVNALNSAGFVVGF